MLLLLPVAAVQFRAASNAFEEVRGGSRRFAERASRDVGSRSVDVGAAAALWRPGAEDFGVRVPPRCRVARHVCRSEAGCERGPALRCVHTKRSQKAGPFSVARLKMDLRFHNRLAYNRVHRRSASPLGCDTQLSGAEGEGSVRGKRGGRKKELIVGHPETSPKTRGQRR